MRYLLFLLLFCSISYAKDTEHIVVPTDVHCFKAQVLLNELKGKYGEDPIFMGKSGLEEGVMTMMFANQDTGSYTVVVAGKGIACVLDTGDNLKYRVPKALENKLM